jgi:hypothetical protein
MQTVLGDLIAVRPSRLHSIVVRPSRLRSIVVRPSRLRFAGGTPAPQPIPKRLPTHDIKTVNSLPDVVRLFLLGLR